MFLPLFGVLAARKGHCGDPYASLSSAEQTSFNLTGWTDPTGGLQLVSVYQVDPLGRTTEETSPNGNVTFTVYRDQYHEVRVYPGWNSTSHTTTGPIEVSREYWPAANAPTGQQTEYSESLTSSATPGYDGGTNDPNGSETIDQTNIQSLSRDLTNGGGQVIEEDAYFSMSGITYSQAVAQLGTSSNDSSTGNYDATLLGYDHAGRPNRTVSPTGTIQNGGKGDEDIYRLECWHGDALPYAWPRRRPRPRRRQSRPADDGDHAVGAKQPDHAICDGRGDHRRLVQQ